MALEAEIDRLNSVVQELQLSKEKYKSRTKELLSALEEVRSSQETHAKSLVQQTLSLRQLADQRDIEVRRLKQQLEQREAENSQLISENRVSTLKQHQKVIFDQNIEKLANSQKKTIKQLEIELEQERQTSQLLTSTVQVFLQIFNVLTDRQLSKTLPKYVIRIFRELQTAGQNQIFPVFIDENHCSMQLLMNSEREINLPRFDRRELYRRMHGNAVKMDQQQADAPADDFVSFQQYLNKIQSDIEHDRDLELKKTYLIQEQACDAQDIDFVPRNALSIMQNFAKIQKMQGNDIRAEEMNNLLVQLSAVFHDYCQRLKEHDMQAKVDALSKEVATLQRKLLLQKPYSQVQYEQQVKRLRAVAQKYRDLYEQILDKKSLGKKVVVKFNDGNTRSKQMEKVHQELAMLRQIVQCQRNQGGAENDAQQSSSTPEEVQFSDSLQYQQGCIATGRVLVSVVESCVGAIYAMKGVDSAVVDKLRECQARCRELLMDMLNGGIDDIDEEVE